MLLESLQRPDHLASMAAPEVRRYGKSHRKKGGVRVF